MARGMPALWSGILGLPFVLGGSYLYLGSVAGTPEVGVAIAGFGLFVVAGGLFVQFVGSPGSFSPQPGETVFEETHPTQRVAVAKILIGFPLLAVAGYFYAFTRVPYVYPTTSFFVGILLFQSGLHTYWRNALTTYYVTDDRVLEQYRLFSLKRKEVRLDKTRAVQETRSFLETVVGLGNVSVSSGDGGGLTVTIRNVPNPDRISEQIRKQL